MKILRYASSTGEIGLAQQHSDGSLTKLRGSLFEKLESTQEPADAAKILAPLVPAAILCIGLNYRQHAAETNTPLPDFPVLFFKNPASVQNPGDPIMLPRWLTSTKVDYECELGVVIGKAARNVPRAQAYEYVLGYTCGNDVSARDWQKEGGGSQWCRGKSFDTFAPLGPVLVTRDEIPNPHALRIRTSIDGEALQDSSTGDMIFDIPTIVSTLASGMTLEPGDIIATGTPAGVGFAMKPPKLLKHLKRPVSKERIWPPSGSTKSPSCWVCRARRRWICSRRKRASM